MNETQNPRDAHPGGLPYNDGDQHVPASVPPEAPYVARLRTLGDNELAQFVHELDTALREARRGPRDPALVDALIDAVASRGLLRGRRARTAGERAKSLVHQLMTTSTEPSR
jgi:hypothetical protein